MPAQTLGNFSIEAKTFYEMTLLKRAKEHFRLYNLARKTTLPKHSGKTISWRKFLPLALPSTLDTGLSEGVTPDSNKNDIIEFAATVKQYGDWIEYTDVLDQMGIDPYVVEVAELFGEQIGKVIETLISRVLVTSCNVWYANNKTTLSVLTASDTITIADISKVKAWLTRCHATPWQDGKYLWFISPEQEHDLKNIAGNSLIETWKYASPERVIKGEIGEFMGFKFIVDNNIVVKAVGASNAKIHHSIVLGKYAGQSPYGIVELEGNTGKPRLIYKEPKDPLNQVATLGWKIMAFAVRLLYEEAIVVYHSGTSIDYTSGFNGKYDDDDRKHYSALNEGNKKTVTTSTEIKEGE